MPEMNSVSTRSKPIGQYPGLASSSAQPPKLLDRLREALRSRHYSQRTEQTYCHWVKRFIYFHNLRRPAQMAEPEINAYIYKRIGITIQSTGRSYLAPVIFSLGKPSLKKRGNGSERQESKMWLVNTCGDFLCFGAELISKGVRQKGKYG